MTVYVDDFRVRHTVGIVHGRWSHLTADTRSELHHFAQRLGLKRSWFQDPVVNGKPPRPKPGSFAAECWHYDVTDGMRWRAIQLGAQPVDSGELLAIISARFERACAADTSTDAGPADARPNAPGLNEPQDVVVTVPKDLWLNWLAEGDLPGQETWPCSFCRTTGRGWPTRGETCRACRGAGHQLTGEAEWHFSVRGTPPPIEVGVRCYVVAHGRLRGYSLVTDLKVYDRRFEIVRRGGAVACTIDEPIRGFPGVLPRWWPRDAEKPFEDFETAGVTF